MTALSPYIAALRAEAVALVDEADAFERCGTPEAARHEAILRALASAKFEAAASLEAKDAAAADKLGIAPSRGN